MVILGKMIITLRSIRLCSFEHVPEGPCPTLSESPCPTLSEGSLGLSTGSRSSSEGACLGGSCPTLSEGPYPRVHVDVE